MPATKIVFFQELDGRVPILAWLDGLQPKRAQAKCLALIKLLSLTGRKLKRPRSDALRDGIRELRTEPNGVNYRVLYFFHGKDCVVLCHGITQKDKVPEIEIERAVKMMQNYKANPSKHTYLEIEHFYEERP